MDVLLRFGSGDYLYTFDPDNQVQIRDNFRDVVAQTSRLPGLSGGYDQYGVAPAPTAIGNVQVTLWLIAASKAEMQAAKETIGRMVSYGTRRLYKRPIDQTQGERYCDARVNSINFNERSGERPERQLQVQINFQVANPYWHALGTEAPSYNDGTTYNSGEVYGGSPVTQSLTGTDNSFSVTPSGNGITFPRFTLEVPSGQSAENIRIQRLVNGQVLDEVAYAGVLAAGDVFEINCRSYAVYLNGVDGYDADFSFITSAWFRLIGGLENTIRVLMDNPTDEIDLELRYYEVFNV